MDLATIPPIVDLESIANIERTAIEDRLVADSAFALLRHQANIRADETAIVFLPSGSLSDTPEVYSYAQLFDIVSRSAHVLHGTVGGSGRTVALLLPNLPETLALIIAGGQGGVACPINPLLDPRDIAALLDASDAHVLVTTAPSYDPALFARAQLATSLAARSIRMLVVRGEAPCGIARLEDELACAPSAPAMTPSGQQVAAYFHTGGTTGRPKLACHTHRMQMVQTEISSLAFAYRSTDTVLTGLPFFHANALFLGGLCCLRAGARTVIAGPHGYRSDALNRDFWRMIEHFGVNFFSAVPTVLARLASIDRAGADLRSLRFATCGGAPIPPSLLSRLQRDFGFRVLEGYGLTEATCLASVNPRDGEQRVGSVGIRAPYMRVRVTVTDADNSARDARPGEVGHLLLSGPSVMPGYHDANSNVGTWLEPGWLDSGDLASLDEQGYIWLHGRAKDLIIRGGHNIDPATVENAIADHPGVAFAAAVAYPDPDLGEKPVLFVELHPDIDVSEPDLIAFARSRSAEPAAAPVRVIPIANLPRTAVGKVAKAELRAMAAVEAYRLLLASSLPADAELEANYDARGLQVVVRTSDPAADLCARLQERLRVCSVPLVVSQPSG